jgi:hypothetical protein
MLAIGKDGMLAEVARNTACDDVLLKFAAEAR